ncbi:MAG: flagellar protein [Lachnospiraceae bacterium]|nr:flagellar protein [Lachnospiraceae bacterium]MCI8779408.1 flagellar protein [Lachnospiraceae bacterium]
MQRLQKNYTSLESIRDQLLQNSPKTSNSPQSELSFQDIFQSTKEQTVDSLKFSKHANERLATRNINLSAEQMERLENGTTKAREKGIRESLVMVDDLAFIVNVKNNTVITAVGDTADSIFTNIDGAVIS